MIQRKSFFAFLLAITLSNLPLLLSAQKPCDYIKGVTKVTGFITPTCFGNCDGVITAKGSVIGPSGIFIKYYFNNDTTYKTPFFANLCSGWYQIVTENRLDGCRDTIVTFLPQPDSINTWIKRSICKGEYYLFNNQMLTKSGTYQAILPALNSCDSIITLNLEVKPSDTTRQEIIICAGATGIISTTFKNKLGCDSTVILNTKIAPTLNVTISRKDSTFSIVTPISGVTYQWLWYDKEIIGANLSTFTAKEKGLYSLRITDMNGCVFTSSQLPFGNIATSDISQNNIKIYPNPIQEQLTISSETNIQKVEFYNIIGQVLLSQKIDNQTFTINTNFLTTGIYFIRIYQNNNEFQIFKITKA